MMMERSTWMFCSFWKRESTGEGALNALAVTAERGLGLKKNEIVTVLGGLHGGSKSGKTAAYNDDVGLDDLDDLIGVHLDAPSC